MSEVSQNFFVRLAQANEVRANQEAEAKRQAEIYELGVKRMSEQRAVYE